MIADHHERAFAQLNVDASRGIGQQERLYSQQLEGPNRKSNLLQRVTLVEVHSSLHGNYWNPFNLADNQSAGMSRNGGSRESRDIRVGDAGGFFQTLCEAPSPSRTIGFARREPCGAIVRAAGSSRE